MSELFDKSIRTLELPRVLELLADQAVSAASQGPLPQSAAGDGARGGAASSGPDGCGAGHDRPAGESLLLRREAGG